MIIILLIFKLSYRNVISQSSDVLASGIEGLARGFISRFAWNINWSWQRCLRCVDCVFAPVVILFFIARAVPAEYSSCNQEEKHGGPPQENCFPDFKSLHCFAAGVVYFLNDVAGGPDDWN